MSVASLRAYADLSAFRRRVQLLTTGLRAVASDEVYDRAMGEVQEMIESVAKSQIGRHVATGTALSDLEVSRAGGLIQVHGLPACNGKNWSGTSYVSRFSWWSFRSGMPPFILKRAMLILARAVYAALGGSGMLGAIAKTVLVDAAEQEKKKLASAARRKLEAKARRSAKKGASPGG